MDVPVDTALVVFEFAYANEALSLKYMPRIYLDISEALWEV